MKRKRTKKPARSQGRKSAVVIPPLPELSEQADAIRALGRRSFDDLVEIGERVTRCRELLKERRVWLAWIKLEFGWSRGHAENLIALHAKRRKLQKFSTLPVSALYLLAKASDKLTKKIARDIAGGRRPLVRDIVQQARAERGAINITPSSGAPSGPRRMVNITAPPQEPTQPTQRRSLLSGDFHHPAAKLFAKQLALFAQSLAEHMPDVVAAALPAQMRKEVIADADAITTFLNELRRALWEGGKPRLVSDEGAE